MAKARAKTKPLNHSVAKPQPNPKTFDTEEERKQRIGGEEKQLQHRGAGEEELRTQEAAQKICAKTKKFEMSNTEDTKDTEENLKPLGELTRMDANRVNAKVVRQ